MYTVRIEKIRVKDHKILSSKEFMPGEPDTEGFREPMNELGDYLYDLDIDYDDVEGDGDMVIDDILVAVSEAEEFTTDLESGQYTYKIEAFY